MTQSLEIDTSYSSNSASALENLVQRARLGMTLSYEDCSNIFLYHPLGAKLVETPLRLAQSHPRRVSIPPLSNNTVANEFNKVWEDIDGDKVIARLVSVMRIYGAAVLMVSNKRQPDLPLSEPLNYRKLSSSDLAFTVIDPLGSMGSFFTELDPSKPDYQKINHVEVWGQTVHPSRWYAMVNEMPIYLRFNSSSFGFVGRSVYQRCAFPLMQYCKAINTDSLLIDKAGVMVYRASVGLVADNVKERAYKTKATTIQGAKRDDVLVIGKDENIDGIDLMHAADTQQLARKNTIENIAAADDMPARVLSGDSFSTGLSEGKEDARQVVRYIRQFRRKLDPAYAFLTSIVQEVAWTKELFKAEKAKELQELEESQESQDGLYSKLRSFEAAFSFWKNNFEAMWESLHEESNVELMKIDETRMNALIGVVGQLLPILKEEDKSALVTWVKMNVNSTEKLFPYDLELSLDPVNHEEPEVAQSGSAQEPKYKESPTRGSVKRVAKEKVSRMNRH